MKSHRTKAPTPSHLARHLAVRVYIASLARYSTLMDTALILLAAWLLLLPGFAALGAGFAAFNETEKE